MIVRGSGPTSKIRGLIMGLYASNCRGESTRRSTVFPEFNIGKLCVVTLLAFFAATLAAAQDIKLNVTYVCNGEHIYVDSCNVRDVSDAATCMVEHPDHVNAGGIAAITSETRGALKKRLPTCQQPSAQEIDAHEAFVKKQQEIYAANVAKANPQPVARPNTGGGPSRYNNQPVTWGQPVQLKSGANSIKLDLQNATPSN
jgi:hypothetical protein